MRKLTLPSTVIRNAKQVGRAQLTLAKIIVVTEAVVAAFLRPFLFLGAFFALSWAGVFVGLYPWPHLVALVGFVVLFVDALSRAQRAYAKPTRAMAERRMKLATGLPHRPYDRVVEHSADIDPANLEAWQQHHIRAQNALHQIRWPKWMLDLSARDPYALRHSVLVLLVIGVVGGWGVLGGRLIGALNPALGRIDLFTPTMSVWITPPEYTHLSPVMIATPAEMRHKDDVIEVPEGSTVSAHMIYQNEGAPTLIVNEDEEVDFTADDHGDYGVSQELHGGDTITIRRGWQKLGSWKVRVVGDKMPAVRFTEAPAVTAQGAIRFAFDAHDDYGVAKVSAVIIPRQTLAGISDKPLEIPLTTAGGKDVTRVDFEDLTGNVWAGLPVDIRLVAEDARGQSVDTKIENFILPERTFNHPIARALIEERKRLIETPDDALLRNEVANLMAGVAQQPGTFRYDPVVMMALRGGAVRLVLDREDAVIPSVIDTLWQSALRVEEGTAGAAERNLRQAQKDLSEALDRDADEAEVNSLIDRLQQALTAYLSEISTHVAARRGPVEELSPVIGDKVNSLTPQDLEKMLGTIRDLSFAGRYDDAVAALLQLRDWFENAGVEALYEGSGSGPMVSTAVDDGSIHLSTGRSAANVNHEQAREILDTLHNRAGRGEPDGAKRDVIRTLLQNF